MIKLNTEYTYKEICGALGWTPSSGTQKQRHIQCIEESYNYYHPINIKTQKPKKSYVFTEQKKEPILVSNRKNNGGSRVGAGRKYLFPDEEFNYLWDFYIINAFKKNIYFEHIWCDEIYFTNTSLFKMFGADYNEILENITFDENDTIAKEKFKDIIYDALKANTISRLCKRYGFKKNSIPKSILRSQSENQSTKLITDNDLLCKYEKYLAEELELNNVKTIKQAIQKNLYTTILKNIQSKFATQDYKYNVIRINVVKVTDIDFIELDSDKYKFDTQKIAEYQNHFLKVIAKSIINSCINRIENGRNYKTVLNKKQKRLLQNYLNQFLEKYYNPDKQNQKESSKAINQTYKSDELTDSNDIREFQELSDYIKSSLLGYSKEHYLSRQSILRLKGLKNGQYMVNRSNSIEFPCDYSYKSWLVTFKAVSQKIKYGLQHNTFTDELHQINYMIKIAESKINEICLAMQRAEKQKQLNEEMAKTLDSMEEIQKRQEFRQIVTDNRRKQNEERKPDFVQKKYKHLW